MLVKVCCRFFNDNLLCNCLSFPNFFNNFFVKLEKKKPISDKKNIVNKVIFGFIPIKNIKIVNVDINNEIIDKKGLNILKLTKLHSFWIFFINSAEFTFK